MIAFVFLLLHVFLLSISTLILPVKSFQLFTHVSKLKQHTNLISSVSRFATSINNNNKDNCIIKEPLHYQQHGKESISKWITKSVTGAVAVTSLLSVPSSSFARLVADAAPSRYPIIGSDEIMRQKSHGTSDAAVQPKLRWNCDVALADRICNYNRNWAEMAGYWLTTSFLKDVDGTSQVTFYDSVTGLPLFIAPKDRSFQDWREESTVHGWPSFRVS